MAAAPLGKAYIQISADLSTFPAELRAKLLAAFKEATAGLDFPELEDAARKGGEEAGVALADEFAQKVEPRMKESGKKSGQSWMRGFGSVLSALGASLLPVLIALAVEMGAALAPVVAALSAAIPAVLGGLIAGAGTLMLAFHGVGAAISAAFAGDPAKLAAAMAKLAPAAREFVGEIQKAKPALSDLQKTIQQAFFVQLEGSITRLVNTLVPMLRVQLSGLASDMGRMGASVASALSGGKGDIATILADARKALAPMVPAMGQLVSAFLKLGAAAGPFLVALSTGLAGVLTKFSNFVSTQAASGGLAKLFNDALVVLRSLGDTLSQAFGVINDIVRALQSTGSDAIGFLGGILGMLNQIFASAAGQNALAAVFNLLNQALSAVFQILQPLLPPLMVFIGALGDQLAQAIIDLTPGLVGISTALGRLLTDITPLLPVIGALSGAIGPILTFLTSQPGLLEAATIAWAAYKLAVAAANVVQATFIAEEAATPWGLIILAIAAIVIGIVMLVQHWQTVEKWGKSAWNAISDAAVAAWHWMEKAWNAVSNFVTGVGTWFQQLPGRILAFIEGLPGMLADLIMRAFNEAATAAGTAIGLLIGAVILLPPKIIGALIGLGAMLGNLFVQAWDWSVNATAAGLDRLIGFVSSLPGRIMSFINSIPSMLSAAFTTAWHWAYNAVVNGANSVINFISGLPGRIRGFMDGVGHDILGGLKSGINSVISSFNHGLDNASGFLHIGLPHIPMLAKGGIVSSPTLAMLGEGGGREVVIPLSNASQAQALAQQSGLLNMLSVPSRAPNVNVFATLGDGTILEVIDKRVEAGISQEADALAHGTRS